MSALSEKVLNLPAVPGVYLFKDSKGQVLYVGKARSLAQRVRNYMGGDVQEPRLRELMAHAVDLDTIFTDTEVEALLLEASLVRHPTDADTLRALMEYSEEVGRHDAARRYAARLGAVRR